MLKHEDRRQGVTGVNSGTMDHMDDEKDIKLTKSDFPDGQHH